MSRKKYRRVRGTNNNFISEDCYTRGVHFQGRVLLFDRREPSRTEKDLTCEERHAIYKRHGYSIPAKDRSGTSTDER